MAKLKFKKRELDERAFCYLCSNPVLKFDSPEQEKKYSETGLCGRCQKQIAKAVEKEGI